METHSVQFVYNIFYNISFLLDVCSKSKLFLHMPVAINVLPDIACLVSGCIWPL
jgi:hypothetical protein